MKTSLLTLLLTFFLISGALQAATPLQWICSTQAEPWKEMAPPATATASPASGEVWKIDSQTTYQVIDGFGGLFQ